MMKLGNSLIQHGKYNDRIYLMKLSEDDLPGIVSQLDKLSLKEGYSKIFAKIPAYCKEIFINNGYMIEAMIPKFYNGKEDAFFIGKYFSAERQVNTKTEEINNVLNAAREKLEDPTEKIPDQGYAYRICGISDALKLSEVYRNVFKTYPFPIFDPDYLIETMKNDVQYFGIWHNDLPIALASTEKDKVSSSVEMTDFATLPAYRGKSFALYLLNKMESEVRTQGYKTAYTIARAVSLGMNITFSKKGYSYGGTLVNNTNISGSLESMNVWYKAL